MILKFRVTMVKKFYKNNIFLNKYLKFCLILLFLIGIQINLIIIPTLAKKKNIPGFSTHDKINPNEPNKYSFSNGIQFGISSNVSIDLNIQFDNNINNRDLSINIKNSAPISLQIQVKREIKNFELIKQPGEPKNGNYMWISRYYCVYQLSSNVSIDKLTVQFNKSIQFGFEANINYSIAVYELNNESWKILPTNEFSNETSSENYLEATLLNLEGDTEYYITIYEISTVPDFWPLIIISIIIVAIITLALAISKTEYINYLKNRITNIDKGAHRLTLEEVLENENRNKILDLILSDPGIHFNELLRQTGIAAGNLVWHLDILETYKIIGKKRLGNYIAYFPYYNKNPISNLDLKLQKSKITLEILEMIEKDPGIYNNLITKKLRVDHKTIHYHLKKLFNLGLIYTKKSGRKKQLFPNLDSEYFNSR